jgi:hypothetical protein
MPAERPPSRLRSVATFLVLLLGCGASALGPVALLQRIADLASAQEAAVKQAAGARAAIKNELAAVERRISDDFRFALAPAARAAENAAATARAHYQHWTLGPAESTDTNWTRALETLGRIGEWQAAIFDRVEEMRGALRYAELRCGATRVRRALTTSH